MIVKEDVEKALKESFDVAKVTNVILDEIQKAFTKGFDLGVKVVNGAEFGYDKANEWNTETPSSAVGNKDLLLQVAKDDFDVGYYHFENKQFYTNDGKEVIPIAWKKIVPPEVK